MIHEINLKKSEEILTNIRYIDKSNQHNLIISAFKTCPYNYKVLRILFDQDENNTLILNLQKIGLGQYLYDFISDLLSELNQGVSSRAKALNKIKLISMVKPRLSSDSRLERLWLRAFPLELPKLRTEIEKYQNIVGSNQHDSVCELFSLNKWDLCEEISDRRISKIVEDKFEQVFSGFENQLILNNIPNSILYIGSPENACEYINKLKGEMINMLLLAKKYYSEKLIELEDYKTKVAKTTKDDEIRYEDCSARLTQLHNKINRVQSEELDRELALGTDDYLEESEGKVCSLYDVVEPLELELKNKYLQCRSIYCDVSGNLYSDRQLFELMYSHPEASTPFNAYVRTSFSKSYQDVEETVANTLKDISTQLDSRLAKRKKRNQIIKRLILLILIIPVALSLNYLIDYVSDAFADIQENITNNRKTVTNIQEAIANIHEAITDIQETVDRNQEVIISNVLINGAVDQSDSLGIEKMYILEGNKIVIYIYNPYNYNIQLDSIELYVTSSSIGNFGASGNLEKRIIEPKQTVDTCGEFDDNLGSCTVTVKSISYRALIGNTQERKTDKFTENNTVSIQVHNFNDDLHPSAS